jgi:hypothetical protein
MPEVQKQKIKPSTRLLAEKLPTPGVSGKSSPLTINCRTGCNGLDRL